MEPNPHVTPNPRYAAVNSNPQLNNGGENAAIVPAAPKEACKTKTRQNSPCGVWKLKLETGILKIQDNAVFGSSQHQL